MKNILLVWGAFNNCGVQEAISLPQARYTGPIL